MALRLRDLTTEEEAQLQKLAHSRTAPARVVERAQILWLAHHGHRVPAIAREVGVCAPLVRTWLKRFNTEGLGGVTDRPRSGCPPRYPAADVAQIIAAALTKPDTLGLPFGAWTLDRLVAYLNEQHGIAIKRSRLDELLLTEGLRWRSQETWFGERVDPEFAKKRGVLKPSIRSRPQRVS